GTGLVHMSPANGEDDFAVAMKRKVPIFAPFDDRVRFTDEAGAYAGTFVRDADASVVRDLSARGAVIHAGKIVHDYPVCWRSGHRLVWLARREYFYWVDRLRNQLTEAAREVEYFFEPSRNRFLGFIAESPPWCITRERVWGTPLPIWVCRDCGEKTGAFSRKRIVELAAELPDGPGFELHRPWIDRVVLKCPKCGGRAEREPFVLDTWHNSGSAPYASFTDAEYKRLVPVPFLTEGIDQTRGWAYTMLVLNVILSGRPKSPFRAFLFQGHVLDENGQKMSKTVGNVLQGLDVLRQNSVDVTRYYLASKGSPEDSVSVGLDEMAGRPYQVLNTLYHLHLYLVQNRVVDGFDQAQHTITWATKRRLLTTVDRWALAKLGSAREDVDEALSSGRFNEAARVLEELVINHTSQTYVRLVRGELWKDDPRERPRRLAIYAVLGHVLSHADRMLHPISPFATEFLYQEAFAPKKWGAPLIFSAPKGTATARVSKSSEVAVDLALLVEEACNSARTKARLKRRWPLKTLEVLVPGGSLAAATRTKRIVETLCNVKSMRVRSSAVGFPATFALRPNRSRFGALFKEKTRDAIAAATILEGTKALRAYLSGKPIRVSGGGGEFMVPIAAYDLSVEPNEGREVGEKGGVFVALVKERDAQMIAEGLVRDIARRLQALRKERGFVPTEMLRLASVAGLDQEDLAMVRPLSKQIAFLVRVKRVELMDERAQGRKWQEDDLDGKPIFVDVG
ncbi:MAG: class I tRNA ligase family protein, partial [Thaumarchaeota archaeon]|nr:class I tRNA ligase family protein [Nitrososphaerota archaeon]